MNVISASPLAAFVASPSNTPSGSGGGEPGSFDAVFAGLAESVDISDAASTDTTIAAPALTGTASTDTTIAAPALTGAALTDTALTDTTIAAPALTDMLTTDVTTTDTMPTGSGPIEEPTVERAAVEPASLDEPSPAMVADEPAPVASASPQAPSDRADAPVEMVGTYEHVDAQDAADATADVVATDAVDTDAVDTDAVDAAASDVDAADSEGEATVGEVSTPAPAAEVVAAVVAAQPVALTDGPDSVASGAPSVEPPAGDAEPIMGSAPTPSPTTAAAAMPSAPSAGAGPSASAESLTTPAPAAPTADYVRQLEQVRQRDVQRVGSTTRLGMSISTEELGTLRLDAVDRSGALHLTLTADDRVARAALVDRSHDLREALRSDGITLDVGTRDDRADQQPDFGRDSRPDRSDPAARREPASAGATQPAPPIARRAVSVDGQLDLQL